MMNSKLFREYSEYLSPSNMYQNLDKTTGSEKNKTPVNTMKTKLANSMVAFKSELTNEAKIIINRNNVLEIVERILYFNQLN